ncbi:Plus3 domain-containing protein [Abeliophyllum distichum]|uniref:Plus3 domain-containing protein n=1 Tax=Abeliophyllum distichum TaxID=126358 RepID=A0ABD1V4E0_9LAMI
MSWGRGQEEVEEGSTGRMVEGINEDEVFSPAPLTAVPPPMRSSPQAETSGEREVVLGTVGRREAEVESGLRTAPVWKCQFFPSEVNEKQLRDWHEAYRVPDDIEFVVPGPSDRADDPPLGCVALNQAVLAAGLRLPFPRVVRKFLREWGIAPTQLCPNGWRILIGFFILWEQLGFPRPSVREFNSLYSFKSDGKRSGWWYASVKAKTGGSVITQTPDSIKNWKKFWFFVRGPWQFSENDTRPDLNIPVRYHELRYISQEPTTESSERARRVRGISDDLRTSSVLITEENLIAARLSPSTSDIPRHRQTGEEMRDISALLRKKTQTHPGKGKRKVQAGDQERSSRQRMEPESEPAHSPTRSVEEVAMPGPVRVGPSTSSLPRTTSSGSQLQPMYLGSTPDKDEEFVRLRGTLPKPVRDFIRSNSPTREEIAGLPLSTRRAIRTVAKCWTPAQQKYLEGMGVVDSVVAASVNVSRAAIQLTSASEKMGRLLADVQVMKEEGRKVLNDLEEEKRLRATSEDVLARREEDVKEKEAEVELAKKRISDLEVQLENEKKTQAELRAALEKTADRDEAVAEFKSSEAYLADQEKVYFLTMEELIDTVSEKRPDWDVQFLKDELSELKKNSKLNPPSPEEEGHSGGEE